MSVQVARGVLLALTLVLLGPASAGAAPNNNNSAKLTQAVTVAGIYEHLNAFQAQANANGGNRFAGLPGHDASAQYVYDRARAAGYDVALSGIQLQRGEDTSVLTKVAPPPTRSYARFIEFRGATSSAPGDVTARLYAVDLNIPSTGGSTSGCEDDDFEDFERGSIALMQRGTCAFVDKVSNAQQRRRDRRDLHERGQRHRPGAPGADQPRRRPAPSPVVGDDLRHRRRSCATA